MHQKKRYPHQKLSWLRTDWRRNSLKERTGCSLWKFPTSTTSRRHMCKHTVTSDVANALVSLASLQRWAVASWDVSTAFLYAQLPEDHIAYCSPPNVLVRLGLVEPGVVWKLNKALYGLGTSPKAWEEERDEKFQNHLHYRWSTGRIV